MSLSELPEKSAKVAFVAAAQVFGNDHLLTEILLHLPAELLLRFKLVSKQWHSLISDPHFCSKWESKSIYGIFLASNRESHNPTFEFISLHDQILGCSEGIVEAAPSKSLNFVDDPLGIQILHSCNGLLLCSSSQDEYVHDSTRYHQMDDTYYPINYYVYNPTTKQYTILPSPPDRLGSLVYGDYLAFDPSKSPHYKVARLHGFLQDSYQFEVYSSQTNTWRLTGVCFRRRSNDLVLNHAVFWNGAIHWFCCHSDTSLCFNVNQERLGIIPMPKLKNGNDHRNFRYFGASRGHLYLIDSSCFQKSRFDVLEMKGDCSSWFVKYRVDLEKVARAFPQMCHYEPKMNYCSCEYSILGVVSEELEEESYLVMYVCGGTISYRFKDEKMKKICDLKLNPRDDLDTSRWGHLFAHQYIESFCSL